MLLIGLTGERGVGKSEAARILARHGFQSLHAFGCGKAMCITYYVRLGIDPEEAVRMVDGDLKDTPCHHLPGGVSSRYFMERFGHFMGVTMGSEWTLGAEIKYMRRRHPSSNFVVESLAYESSLFKELGGTVVRLVRDGNRPKGEFTDKGQSHVRHNYVIENNGTMEQLERRLMDIVTFEREALLNREV